MCKTQCKLSMAVVEYLAAFIKSPLMSVQRSEGGDSTDGSDPYYVTKQWFSDDVPNLNFTNIIGVQEVKDAFMVDVVAPLRSEFKEVYRRFRGNQMRKRM